VEIVIASRNLHKIRELRRILKDQFPRLDILSLLDFPAYEPPEETGKTFEENVILKATHAATALHLLTLADDSGLIIPILDGAPGLFSARFAGKGASDAENRKKLLHEMEDVPDDQRTGYFECAIALADPDGLKKVVSGTCEGTILKKERGNKGFGYDPLFVKHDYSKTFAELEEAVKNRVSHRRKALDKILPYIDSLLHSPHLR